MLGKSGASSFRIGINSQTLEFQPLIISDFTQSTAPASSLSDVSLTILMAQATVLQQILDDQTTTLRQTSA